MRIAYFTAGEVGAGHLSRGIAISRALVRRGWRGEYRMFGPALPYPTATRDDYEPVRVVRAETETPDVARASDLAARLAAYRPDLLLVDLFWAPLRYILPLANCEAWLFARICPAPWFRGPPNAPFAREQYTRVVGIEPRAHPRLNEVIDPIVVANREDCRPPGALRAHLGVPDGAPLHVVMHAGARGESATLSPASAPDAHVARFDLFDAAALYPLAEWLGDADRLTCGGGYNSFWEAQWLGYAARTTFVPFARKIDDQARRLRYPYAMKENGADTIARWISPG